MARDETLRYVGPPLQDFCPKDVHISRNTHLIDRLYMLNARAGGLSRKDAVMPIDLIFDEIEKVGPLCVVFVLGLDGTDFIIRRRSESTGSPPKIQDVWQPSPLYLKCILDGSQSFRKTSIDLSSRIETLKRGLHGVSLIMRFLKGTGVRWRAPRL